MSNDFLPFATQSGANVLSQSDYASLSAIATGYTAGIAKSNALNKTWRQSSIMAAVLAQFISDQTGANSVDDGTTATLLANLKKSTPGRLLRTTIFINVGTTTNIQASIDGGAFAAQSTWTALAAATRVEVQVQAAGGGGGGTPSTAAGQAVASPGGGGGGYGFKTYVAASIPAGPINVTPGIGGLGGNGVTGFNGTASSFGALISTTGGAGGGAPAPLAGTQIQGGTVGGAAGTGGDINYAGQAALGSYSIAGARAVAGSGANSMFGVGGCGQQDNTSGSQATGFGSGGPGRAQGASAAALQGGAGTNGIVVVREFA